MKERERLHVARLIISAQSDLDRAVRRKDDGLRDMALEDVINAVSRLAEVVELLWKEGGE